MRSLHRLGPTVALLLPIMVVLLATGPANADQSDLIFAAGAGDLARVDALLSTKADINTKTTEGKTALIVASENGHLGVVQALLGANADVNAEMSNGFSALMIAAGNGHLEVVRALLA